MRYNQFTVIGYVQGVGFREHARRQAMRAGLKGWVQNRPDGSVEILCRGEQLSVDTFVSWLRHGPPMARVDTVQSAAVEHASPLYRELQSCDGFSIRF